MNPENATAALVVDDDPAVLALIEKRLTTWGYRVATASGGRQALEVLSEGLPDVVITDLFMPEMDGFAVLAHIQQNASDLPVIVLSGQGELKDAIAALRLGAWDYLYKPIEEMAFLRLAIEKVLEKARLIRENRNYRDHLEALVAEKSALLVDKTLGLEKANEALKALLDQRETEKNSIEQTMVSNLKRFVLPYLDEIEAARTHKEAKAYLDIARTNIAQLVAPVSKRLGGVYLDFTPTEVKVADLIRQGHSTKAIAQALNTSASTVAIHRNNIRKKLGILNKKNNLRTYLNALV